MLSGKNISFVYEDAAQPSLDHVNMEVGKGQLLVITGKSGCGKTTISRIVNGLIPELYEGELEGHCLLDGTETIDQPIYQLSRRVGSVFQNPKTQFFTTDVRSELAFPLENMGMERETISKRMDQVTALFGIERLLDRSMFSLSGGEKQMIAIASSCMADPELLVLDEPSSNLDVEAIEELTAILGKLKALGLTILVIEHRLYYLRDLADRFLVIRDGQVAGTFTPESMAAISPEEREQLGLRALVLPEPHNADSPASATVTATGRSESSLRVTNLSFSYDHGQTPAVQIDDLTVSNQQITGIIGRNGAGKSTLANLLTGLHKAEHGSEFFLNGKRQSTRKLIENSYMVFQDVNYQLFCESVRKELLLGARRPELLDDVTSELDLNGLLDRHPNTLSGGEKQRVAIAAAIMADKHLVILDEPTSGLDLYHMNQVTRAIRYMQDRGTIILIISHDEEFLRQTCQRFLTFRQGRLVTDQNSMESLIGAL